MGFSLTYKCSSKQSLLEDSKQSSQVDSPELKIKEIEEKIMTLDGFLQNPLEVDIDLFFHKTYKDLNKDMLTSNLYEKCIFIHEKEEEKDTYVMVAFSKSDDYWESFQVEEKFKRK